MAKKGAREVAKALFKKAEHLTRKKDSDFLRKAVKETAGKKSSHEYHKALAKGVKADRDKMTAMRTRELAHKKKKSYTSKIPRP